MEDFINDFVKFACERDWDLEYHCLKDLLIEFFEKENKYNVW